MNNALDIMNAICSESGFEVYSPRDAMGGKANTLVILDELDIDRNASKEYLRDLGKEIEEDSRKKIGDNDEICDFFVDLEYLERREACIRFFAHVAVSDRAPSTVDLTDGRVYLH